MRIARVSRGGAIAFAVLEGQTAELLAGPPIGELRRSGDRVPLAECRLLAPTLPSKIVCVGRNYPDHAKEMGGEVPAEPLLFLKPSTAVIGPGEAIRKPAVTERLDHEAELCVVIGGLVRNADAEAARAGILGYTCGNDVTARDLQKRDGQWTRGKGFDTFCPLGPWIETELEWQDATIECRVNGETRQRGAAKEMFFDPVTLTSYVSRIMTLLPGDVIMTGTPAGVGPMQPGDACEVEISGIAILPNPVA